MHAEHFRLRQTTAADFPMIARIWNAHYGKHYPLESSVLAQLASTPWYDPALAWVAEHNGDVVGAIAGKAPHVSWLPPDLGFLSYLVTAPEVQHRGIGSALYTTLAEALRARGRQWLLVGGDPGHLVPGIPLEASLTTWHFFRSRGATPREVFVDLLLDLRLPLPGTRPEITTLEPVDATHLLPFLTRVFPGRWEADMEQYLQAGGTVLGLWAQGELVGFVAVYVPGQSYRGPSQFWAQALPEPAGGMGPLGLASEARGKGLGIALVRGAAQWLREHGCAFAVIDWTELAAFYGRLGAHLWRAYQSAVLPLSDTLGHE